MRQHVSRSFPDQGEPTARSRGGDHGRGKGLPFWDRGGEQAGAAGGVGGAYGPGIADHLQRI